MSAKLRDALQVLLMRPVNLTLISAYLMPGDSQLDSLPSYYLPIILVMTGRNLLNQHVVLLTPQKYQILFLLNNNGFSSWFHKTNEAKYQNIVISTGDHESMFILYGFLNDTPTTQW
jgi:hypothetical protein